VPAPGPRGLSIADIGLLLERFGLADPSTALYCVLVVFAAYLIRGVAGFGSGLIAVPLLSLAAPVPLVVPLVVTLDYIGSAGQGIRNLGQVAWRAQILLIPFMVVGIGLGLFMLRTIPPTTLARVLGAFVIVFALSQWLSVPAIPGSRIAAGLGGVLGGMVGTLFGTGGPFYVIYLRLRELDKGAFRATFATNFLIDGGIRLAAYTAMGLYDRTVLLATVVAFPVAAVALLTGGRIHTGLSQLAFMRLISLLLLASGLALLLRG
jgi:uncharacterized membrane protein YfcA